MNQKLLSTLSQYKKIILVGGGTGGHIQPIVSIVKNLKNTDINLTWIGGIHSEEEKVANTENIQFFSIPTLKLSTTRSFKIFLYPVFLILGIWNSRKILNTIQKGGKAMNLGGLGRETVGVRGKKNIGGAERASFSLPNSFGTFSTKSTEKSLPETENNRLCIFSKGGPGSVAIGIAAWSLGVPLYIHESDTIPGRSNRILGKIATKVFLGFESAKQYFTSQKCEVIGQILDPIFSIKSTYQPIYQSVINWKTSKPHILVICGSQGAKSVFDAIIDQFKDAESYEWIIALGKLNSSMQSEFGVLGNCQAISWISQENIAHLIQDTNIAITRGSATTLAELTSNQEKIPKLIIIPLPYSAGNHQYYNALEYEKLGHILLEQQSIKELKNTIYNLQ